MSNFKILIKLKIQCKFVRLTLLICILMQVFATLKYYIYIYYPRTILHYMFKNNMPEKNGLMSLTLCHTHGTK